MWRQQRYHYLDAAGKKFDAEGRIFFYQLEEHEVAIMMNPTSTHASNPWDHLTPRRAFNSEHITNLLFQSKLNIYNS